MAWSKRRKADELSDAPPDPAVLRGRTERRQAADLSQLTQLIKKKVLPTLNEVLRSGNVRIVEGITINRVGDCVYMYKRKTSSSWIWCKWAEILLQALQDPKYRGYKVELIGLYGERAFKHDVLDKRNVEKSAKEFLDKNKGRIGVRLS